MILYKTKVKINTGFYKGQIGFVIEKGMFGKYRVETNDWRANGRLYSEKDLIVVEEDGV